MSFFRKVGQGLSSTFGFIWWPFAGLYKLLFRNPTPRKKVWYSFVAILALALLAFLVDWPKLPTWVPGQAWFTKKANSAKAKMATNEYHTFLRGEIGRAHV